MNYRNQKLRDVAEKCETCLDCGRYAKGQVVAAHSNQMRDGKGKGIKAHDYRVAYVCEKCHAEIDQFINMTRTEAVERWELAHRKTIAWLFESNLILIR